MNEKPLKAPKGIPSFVIRKLQRFKILHQISSTDLWLQRVNYQRQRETIKGSDFRLLPLLKDN